MTHRTPRPNLLFSLLLTVLAAAAARGQEPATAPATAQATARVGAADDAGAAVVVTAVEGKARARTAPDVAWQMVATGMRLPAGAEISTGPNARVTCSIPPGQEFVVDRMSNVTVLEARRSGNRQQTQLMMEYGRTAARVQAAGVEHDMRIRTPATTASVRGTEYTVYDQPPFAPELQTYTGLVDYRFAKRQISVGRGGRSRGGRGAAETALLQSVVDPSTARARTTADAALIAAETSRGAVVAYDPDIRLSEIRGGAGPQTDAALLNSLPGRLNFVLRWNANVDVDVFVTVQPGDQLNTIANGTFSPQSFLYPGYGFETSPTGGRIPYNHRGGPNGGQEICFWPNSFPEAVYGFSAINNSEESSADVRFNAFVDGEKVSLYTFGLDGSLTRSKGIRRTLGPQGTESTIVLAPANPLFESLLDEGPDETLDGQPAQAAAAAPAKTRPGREAKPKHARAAKPKHAARERTVVAAKAPRQKPAAKAAVKPRKQSPAPTRALAQNIHVSAAPPARAKR